MHPQCLSLGQLHLTRCPDPLGRCEIYMSKWKDEIKQNCLMYVYMTAIHNAHVLAQRTWINAANLFLEPQSTTKCPLPQSFWSTAIVPATSPSPPLPNTRARLQKARILRDNIHCSAQPSAGTDGSATLTYRQTDRCNLQFRPWHQMPSAPHLHLYTERLIGTAE